MGGGRSPPAARRLPRGHSAAQSAAGTKARRDTEELLCSGTAEEKNGEVKGRKEGKKGPGKEDFLSFFFCFFFPIIF